MDQLPYYSTNCEIADALGVTVSFVDEQIELGNLPVSITMFGKPCIRRPIVERWMQKFEASIRVAYLAKAELDREITP